MALATPVQVSLVQTVSVTTSDTTAVDSASVLPEGRGVGPELPVGSPVAASEVSAEVSAEVSEASVEASVVASEAADEVSEASDDTSVDEAVLEASELDAEVEGLAPWAEATEE